MPKPPEPQAVPEPTFEDALDEIQSIVQELEGGALGLEDSLRRFEAGVRLIRRCHQTLELAEQRIKILTDVDPQGNPVLEDFDASATLEQKKPAAGRRKKSPPPEETPGDSEGFSLF